MRRAVIPKIFTMVAIADLFDSAHARVPVAVRTADMIVVHLANPKRRALIRAIGYAEVSESYLRALYGPSWPDVQADLRVLLDAGVIIAHGIGATSSYSLHLGSFPVAVLDNVLRGKQQFAVAA